MTVDLKQTESDIRLFIQAHQLTPLQLIDEGAESVASAEAEEMPALTNLKNELGDSFDATLKMHCETAIASYLNQLEQEDFLEKDEALERLACIQERVISTLETHVRYLDHDVRVLDECRTSCTCCYVVPTYIVEKMQQIDAIREQTLDINALEEEEVPAEIKQAAAYFAVGQEPLISIYTAHNSTELPGQFVTSNYSPNPSIDSTAQKALDGARDVHLFWLNAYGLSSYDGKGSEIKSTVHYGVGYANALWNGKQMIYGDGNDVVQNLTELSIIGHEFGHAITGNKLNYEGESGALNEHLSDVWGSLVLQFKNGQTADQASWLIGEGVIKLGNQSYPLRSMKAPGHAYNSPIIGKDPQPDHYSNCYTGSEDSGGVHINSGIPNKAFYLFAAAQGGYAWQKAGLLWFLTLKTGNLLKPNCTMAEFAHATISTALKHFPTDYKMHQDLIQAWKAVGLA